jgi:hypothetical protein
MLIIAACLASVFGVSILVPVTGNSAGLRPTPQLSPIERLRQQLLSLRPRSPQEFEFLDRVIDLVEQKKLPTQVVEAAYDWARKRRRRYQFPYFQRAVVILAARTAIRIS